MKSLIKIYFKYMALAIIIIFMFIGRVGSLTFFTALLIRKNKKKTLIRYPEDKIIVG